MNYYSINIILTWVTLIILSVLVRENDRIARRDAASYYLTYGVIALAALAEWLGLRFNGDPSIPVWALQAVKCADYILTPLAGGALIAQLHRRSIFRVLIQSILAVNTAFQLAAVFTGWMITVHERHFYSHGPLYEIYIALYLLLIVLVVLEFVTYGRSFRRQNKVSLYSTLLLIVAGIMVQELTGGTFRTAYLTLAIGMALMFIHNTEFMQLTADESLREQRFQMMMSQIQPHFLYNSLGAIQELCDSDPKAAGNAVAMFSRYLRGNMESINQSGMIPFEKELEHTRLYLALEKMRFEAALQVSYDIACTDFSLPALTLQPIAENAVRHGARGKKQKVGTVAVSSREYADRIEISVADNGPGFDPDAPQTDDCRTHIGIQNVRDRLQHACSGALRIESDPATGTVVTIVIPKKTAQTGEETC